MFTGIIQATGIVQKNKGSTFLVKVRGCNVPKGGSVSIDGVCLTSLKKNELVFEIMEPTLKKTTLGLKKVGDIVNVELALLAGQPLGGHFVSGHVDGIGIIRKWQKPYLTIKIPKRLIKYIIPRGSVAVNGVSLTVVEVKNTRKSAGRSNLRYNGDWISEHHDWFSVALTDYTLKHTNLKNLQKGGKVNIEVDLLAKYVRNRCK